MTERLLQYIWQNQHFNHHSLALQSGESVHVIEPGLLNKNQGPDFLEARIRIGDKVWIGSVEIHIRTSEWQRHLHDTDSNYNNVVLHVVWEDDGAMVGIPLLTLNNRVSKLMLQQYEDWMFAKSFIPCQNNIAQIPDLVWTSWKERLVVERLIRKSEVIYKYLQQNHFHWEETFWWMLARNFGLKVNAEAFESMARSLPLTILARHKGQVHQLEALLFGQAALLERKFVDHYPRMLQKEYRFLRKKYRLQFINQPIHFLRMRPVNFPTIRIAQLVMLISQSSHLLSIVRECTSVNDLCNLFRVTANDYWHYHFNFDETSTYQPKTLGAQMIHNIIVNTISPMLFAFGHFQKDNNLKERGLAFLAQLPGEKNHITDGFQRFGIINRHAFDSQSLNELKTQYCDVYKCLDCAVGNSLLRNCSALSLSDMRR